MPSKDDAKDVAKSTGPVEKKDKVVAKKPAAPKAKVSPAQEPKAAPVAAGLDTSEAPAKRRVDLQAMKGPAIKIGAAVIGLLALVVIVFGVLIYVNHSENPAVKAVAKIIPYPIERVNGRFITYSDYMFQVDSEKMAQQSNAKINNQPAIDFNSASGKKLVEQIKQHSIANLEQNAVVEDLASKKGVKVTDKEVNDALDQISKSNGGKETVQKTIQSYYGWNWNDLKNILRRQILQKNLSDKITSDPAADAAAKTKAQNIVNEIKGGADFSDEAKKNSQASDASTGGDLGFFTKGQLPDALQKAAEALQPGQVSDPVKDDYGYEIIKVVEKKDDGSIHGQHILIKTVDFTSYMQDQVAKAKINKYLKV